MCKPKLPNIITSPAPESYIPNSVGSEWTYQLGGLLTGTKKVISTGRDTSFPISAIPFKIMQIEGGQQEYEAKVGNDYYTTVPNSTNNTPLKIIKGDAQINEEWIGAINGTDTYFVKMLERDINFNIDTFNFPKTIHIKQTRRDVNGIKTMDLDTWIAYNIGYVKTSGTLIGFPYSATITKAIIK
jgi:hypothetical protein